MRRILLVRFGRKYRRGTNDKSIMRFYWVQQVGQTNREEVQNLSEDQNPDGRHRSGNRWLNKAKLQRLAGVTSPIPSPPPFLFIFFILIFFTILRVFPISAEIFISF